MDNCLLFQKGENNDVLLYLYRLYAVYANNSSLKKSVLSRNVSGTLQRTIFLRENRSLISSDLVENKAGVGELAIASLCDSSLVVIIESRF